MPATKKHTTKSQRTSKKTRITPDTSSKRRKNNPCVNDRSNTNSVTAVNNSKVNDDADEIGDDDNGGDEGAMNTYSLEGFEEEQRKQGEEDRLQQGEDEQRRKPDLLNGIDDGYPIGENELPCNDATNIVEDLRNQVKTLRRENTVLRHELMFLEQLKEQEKNVLREELEKAEQCKERENKALREELKKAEQCKEEGVVRIVDVPLSKTDENTISNFTRNYMYPKIKIIDDLEFFEDNPTIMPKVYSLMGIEDNYVKQQEKEKATIKCIRENLTGARSYTKTQMMQAFKSTCVCVWMVFVLAFSCF